MTDILTDDNVQEGETVNGGEEIKLPVYQISKWFNELLS